MKRAAIAAVSAALIFSAAPAQAKPIVTISGSTSVYPLIAQLIPAFLRAKGSVASFRVYQGGSDVGVADAAYGRVSIGMASRDEKGADPHALVWNKFARDAICLITNRANRIPSMSQATIKAIFTGKVGNWASVPGSTIHGPIDIVSRTAASGTEAMFQKLFLGTGSQVTTRAIRKDSNGLARQSVVSDRYAIGYVSYGFVGGANPISYGGYACNLTNAKSGAYPAVRNFWLVTRGFPTGVAADFIDWAQNSVAAQRLVANGYVPLN